MNIRYTFKILLLGTIVVLCRCSGGNGEVQSKAEAPGAPTGIVAKFMGAGEVELTWKAPSNPGKTKNGDIAKILSYTVSYDDQKGFSSPKSEVGIETTTKKIKELDEGTYYFKVRATNNSGEGGKTNSPFSETATVEVTGGAPPPSGDPVEVHLKGGASLPDKFELAQGGQVALDAVVKDGTATWTSSNTAVATVNDEGTVSGVSEGAATITATSSNDATEKMDIIIDVIYQDYRDDIFDRGPGNSTWYAITAFKTKDGVTNIDYSYEMPSSGDPSTYEYVSRGLTISKNAESFTVEATIGRDVSNVAVWVDWELDGYFAGKIDSPPDEQYDFSILATPPASNSAGDVLTKVIPIPGRARVGKGRMRVLVNWGGDTSKDGNFWTYDDDTGKIYIESGAVRDFDIEITE